MASITTTTDEINQGMNEAIRNMDTYDGTLYVNDITGDAFRYTSGTGYVPVENPVAWDTVVFNDNFYAPITSNGIVTDKNIEFWKSMGV